MSLFLLETVPLKLCLSRLVRLSDNIETNLLSVARDTHGASTQLTEAHAYQRKAGRRMFCLLLVFLLVLTVVLLAVSVLPLFLRFRCRRAYLPEGCSRSSLDLIFFLVVLFRHSVQGLSSIFSRSSTLSLCCEFYSVIPIRASETETEISSRVTRNHSNKLHLTSLEAYETHSEFPTILFLPLI